MTRSPEKFVLLGPVRAWHGPAEVRLGSPRQRLVMSVLLLRRDLPVPVDDLVDAVWDDRPPASAVNQLHIYVHRLRRAMEEAGRPESPIEYVGRGYRLQTPPEAVDLEVFQTTMSEAQEARRTEPGRARTLVGQALFLWQGAALADLPGEWAQAQRVRLDQMHLDALETSLRLDLDTGIQYDMAAELAGVIAQHPLDERFREILMLALYRSGRQAAALEVYADTRALLAEKLGVGPGQALQQMYERILRADPGLLVPESDRRPAVVTAPRQQPAQAAGVVPIPAQLPCDLPVFSGRRRETDEVVRVAETGRRHGGGTVLCVVGGSAGVGKTTFAVHAAHRLAPDYPDGQIHLDLHGFDSHESPVPPRRAMRSVLESLGVSADRLPEDPDAQTALYRSLLADRRVLLLLDNARDSRQVRPLLPSAPGALVIITSRDQLSGLLVRDGAHYLRLETLTATEARDLLVRRLGADCVGADAAATEAIVERGAGLPLALALIAGRAATRGAGSLTAIAEELRETAATLDALADRDRSLDVRSVFSWSYEALPPEAARLYRLSSLTPSTGCSTAALAALADLPKARVRVVLSELTGSHLVDESDSGRFLSHDLLREYAAELLATHEDADDRSAAFRRLLGHYLRTAYLAARAIAVNLPSLALHPDAADAGADDVTDPERALSWFAREAEALTQLVGRAGAVPGCETQTWQLAWSLMEFLQREGRWDDQITTQRSALDAALRGGDAVGRSHSRRNLGRAYIQAGRLDEADEQLARALDLFTELGDLDGQARCHGNLALVKTHRGDHRGALPHVHRAVEQFEAAGDRRCQAAALNNLGWTYARIGSCREGLKHCRRALALLRDTGDRVAEAATWDSLGYIHHRLGEYEQAVDHYRRALELDRRLGDLFNGAETLAHLGETRLAMGDPDSAREAWQAALAVFQELAPLAAAQVGERLAGLEATAADAVGNPRGG
ncbi:BTAD domain-containing putative transcriptional regulator [Streptomyces sp. NBC_00878]|uniref:AfsR/SARP family transcriptional regulator n=1 Tax=Streptomyces sp. NBC_00878 TaxID=2975854 RepID=UPI00225414EE|nr:BTAD domain-containing putative transcriptional regulator [Streptomyces sp. NBC_00878]MCX4911133.1 tetratricopeptide repeat protein [Streptomyces sp. NBC_00878]